MAFAAYISAAANRHPQAADISSSSLIAFGSCKLVALWDVADPDDRGVFQSLPGHEGLVTCVRFIGDDVLASTDDNGIMRCWRNIGAHWISTAKVQAHKKAISSLCFHDRILATGSSDASVKIWAYTGGDNSDKLEEVQVLPLNGAYPLSLALTSLPQSESSVMLAIGGTDRKIHVWVRSEVVFVHSLVLSGHEDWVRSLTFSVTAPQDDSLILASGSQDATIRLWKIEKLSVPDGTPKDILSDGLMDDFEASVLGQTGAEENGRQISLRRHIFNVQDKNRLHRFSITFDALLVGHEAGITSLRWRPRNKSRSIPSLLSTSTDSSLILWSPSASIESEDRGSSIWIGRQRFGDIGGQRLGGFVCGLWARSGDETLASGWGGGWRRWCCKSHIDNDEYWTEVPGVSGHQGPVRGLDWSQNGEYLISSGLDQTTRIHGAIPIAGTVPPVWHELSRPQIHGYDLLGVKFLNLLKFISIADEKVARVFEAPHSFVKMIEGLNVAKFVPDEHERPLAATVAPLGLSNKAVSDADSQPRGMSKSDDPNPAMTRPREGDLSAVTLWPEVEKVFGHGYESIGLAVSNSRKLVATACKATTAEHAVVRIYEADRWTLVGNPLEGHSLTVTRISFSPDDRLVLTVSRDRSWRLFEAIDGGGYLPLTADKSHARIIWDGVWACEGDVFATASRDKTVKIWKASESTSKKWVTVATIKIKEAGATAVAFSPVDQLHRRRLAIGLENGHILIYQSEKLTPSAWSLALALDSSVAHDDHIYQLSWRPTNDVSQLQLASCSEDGTAKLLIVRVATNVKHHP